MWSCWLVVGTSVATSVEWTQIHTETVSKWSMYRYFIPCTVAVLAGRIISLLGQVERSGDGSGGDLLPLLFGQL